MSHRAPVVSQVGRLNRSQAANLLRSARTAFAARTANAGELIGWAFSAMRESQPAQRLKIDHLLHVGNFDSADALIARCLLQGSDHPLLRLRYAHSAHAQGRLQRADAEIQRVLSQRPDHIGALRLAARIATDQGEHGRAASFLSAAAARRPFDQPIQCDLVQSLLDAGAFHEAQQRLDALPFAPAALAARMLRAQNRLLDAVDLLELAIDDPALQSQHQANFCELIDCLEHIGDGPRLNRLMAGLKDPPPEAALRAAQAALALGDTALAGNMLTIACAEPRLRRQALRTKTVVEALTGSDNQARAALAEMRTRVHCTPAPLRSHPGSAEMTRQHTMAMAKTWLGGMLGRIAAGRTDARESGTDPSTSVLQPLLRQAVAMFDAALRSSPSVAADRSALEQDRAVCLQAMGRGDAVPQVTPERVDRAGGQSQAAPADQPQSFRQAA